MQYYGGAVYWLNHYAANQQPLEHFAAHIHTWQRQYGHIATHFLPHDAAHRDPHGQSYVESLAQCGITAVRVVPRTPDIWRGINNLRMLLPRSWFHRDTLLQRINARGQQEPSGLTCLEMYHTAPPSPSGIAHDTPSGIAHDTPVHDAASHSADAARMFAEALSHGLVSPISYTRKRARM